MTTMGGEDDRMEKAIEKYSDPTELSDRDLGAITRVLIGKVLSRKQASALHELITLTTTVRKD